MPHAQISRTSRAASGESLKRHAGLRLRPSFSLFSLERLEEFFPVRALTAFEGGPALTDFLLEFLDLELSDAVPLFEKPQGLADYFARGVAAALHSVLDERSELGHEVDVHGGAPEPQNIMVVDTCHLGHKADKAEPSRPIRTSGSGGKSTCNFFSGRSGELAE